MLYGLQHLGYVVPPQADAGWIGEAGPGPSYLDEGSGGPENDFTQRNTTFMTWNLMHTGPHGEGRRTASPPTATSDRLWDAGCQLRPPEPGLPLRQAKRRRR